LFSRFLLLGGFFTIRATLEEMKMPKTLLIISTLVILAMGHGGQTLTNDLQGKADFEKTLEKITPVKLQLAEAAYELQPLLDRSLLEMNSKPLKRLPLIFPELYQRAEARCE
jgi:hypothetical protein